MKQVALSVYLGDSFSHQPPVPKSTDWSSAQTVRPCPAAAQSFNLHSLLWSLQYFTLCLEKTSTTVNSKQGEGISCTRKPLMWLKRSNPKVERVIKTAFDGTSSCLIIKAWGSWVFHLRHLQIRTKICFCCRRLAAALNTEASKQR